MTEIKKMSVVSRRLLLRTAALSPLALATAAARADAAGKASPEVREVQPTYCEDADKCDPFVFSMAIHECWQSFFQGAGRDVELDCYTVASDRYARSLFYNIQCWCDEDGRKRGRALMCANLAGAKAALLTGGASSVKIPPDKFLEACMDIEKGYQEKCDRLCSEEPPPGIICG